MILHCVSGQSLGTYLCCSSVQCAALSRNVAAVTQCGVALLDCSHETRADQPLF